MRTIFVTALLFASFVACSKYETCDGVTISAPQTAAKSIAAASPFYCKEMEEVFNIDAKEYVGGFVGGRLSFVKAFKESYVEGAETPECTDMKTDDIPISYPEEIIVGPLLSCKIGKAPPNTDCDDTFFLTFATEDGGSVVTTDGPEMPPRFNGHYMDSSFQPGDDHLVFGSCIHNPCVVANGGDLICGQTPLLLEKMGVFLLYEWHPPL